MKSFLKQMIVDFHNQTVPSTMMRAVNLSSLSKLASRLNKANVFIGMRRSGKTYLMYQQMHDLIKSGIDPKKIVYINFEDDRLINFSVSHFQDILDAYFELYPHYAHAKDLQFFFDEIQNVDGWEKFIRRLLDKEQIKIYITGSSAKALSKEISTSLRGRSIVTEVFPMSFYEFLSHHNVGELSHLSSKQLSLVRHLSLEYLKYGGFPETLLVERNHHRLLMQEYVNSVVYRDVIERHSIKNMHVVKLFLTHCLENTASGLSITKLYNTFKSMGENIGKNSLYDYLDYFADAFLLFPISLYDFSLRKRQVNPKKIYCADPGLITAYAVNAEMSQSATLENAVFNQLRRNHEAIFYYKTRTSKEVDFVFQDDEHKIHLVQACLDISKDKTRAREMNALIEAKEELNAQSAIIVTLDREEKIADKNISVLPFWKFACDFNKVFDGIS